MSQNRVTGIGLVIAVLMFAVGVALWRSLSTPAIHIQEPRIAQHAARAVTEAPATAPSPAAPQHILPNSNSMGSASGAADGGAAAAEVVVHVAGAVVHPGVYHLTQNARNDDAVKAAGGFRADAYPASINLAARASDGSQLYVKSRQEQSTGPADGAAPGIVSAGGGKSAADHTGSRASASGTHSSSSNKLKSPSDGTVNINTSTAEQLQRIPNVGPAIAARIIAYREANHGFQAPEDLMQVSGIGQKKFAKMEPFIRVR